MSSPSSSSDANLAALINNAGNQINRYLGIFLFVFGFIGNILNILVFRQRILRSNPCAWLFLISSIASLVLFLVGLTARILSGWNLDYTTTNQVLCKLRAFIIFACPAIILWLIVLATIDRWLSSSIQVHRRQMSTLKNSQRCSILVVCILAGYYIQMFFCYEANLINSPLQCFSKSIQCLYLADVSIAFVNILLPLFFMALFGLLTIANIRQFHRQVHPMNMIELAGTGNKNSAANANSQTRQQKRIDRQLLLMLLFQVTLLAIFSLPLLIQRLYATFTLNNSKTILQKTIENFFFSFTLLLSYVAFGLPFYIYTLSGGNIFRKSLFEVLQNLRRIILH
jgi:hypothetical protein